MSARRIEFTVSEEEWQMLERARGLIPRAAYLKALLFDRHTDLPPIWASDDEADDDRK